MDSDNFRSDQDIKNRHPLWVRLIAITILVAGSGAFAYFALRPNGGDQTTTIEAQTAGRPADIPTPELSFGPAEASNLKPTIAPGVSVEIIPSAKSLGSARFDGFDVSPSGRLLVSEGSRLIDLITGEDIFTGGERVRSFAFAGETLAAVDSDGRLGYYDAGRFHFVGKSVLNDARLTPSSDHTRLFFSRTTYDHEGVAPAIAAVREGLAPEVLTGSISPIDAVGGDSFLTYYSVGDALFQLISPGEPRLLLVLPQPEQTIVGIAAGGGAIYFSTRDAVYTLTEGLALPLVLGLGGELRLSNGRLFVLSSEHGRVYSIIVEQGKS